MVAATYTSDLTDIFLFESTTGVTAFGGGASGLGASPDYAVEGTNAVDKQISASEKGFLFAAGAAFTIGADDHFYIWANLAVYGLADTRNNRGIAVCIGDDTSNFVQFHVAGNDTLPLGGANPYAVRFVNTTLTNFRTLTGTPGTSPDNIGVSANVTGTAKFSNLGADAARIGTGYDILNGTGADPEADFAGIASDDAGTAEGVLLVVPGGFKLQGKLRIGSASTACEFLDSNTNILINDTIHSLTDFNEILVEHASSIVTLTNVNFQALGTNSPGRLEMLTATATLTFTNVGFIDWADTILGSGATMTGCRWIGSGQITANSATFNGSSFSGYEGTADTSYLIWDTAVDPDGDLDNTTFTKGTAATHAIELGTTSPLSMTFTDVTSSGYNAANGNNDSFFHVKRTSGTVTINIAGGSGNFSYRTDGATVNVVTSVPLTITVKDSGGAAIANARVIVVDRSTDPPTEHMNELTTAAGVATEAYGGSTPLAIEIEVRRGDGTGGINYFPVKVPETITSSGLTNTVTLLVDPINSTLVTAGEAVLATAVAWWAADEPGNTITGGNVETLLDKTGNSNNPTQGTAANRPAETTGGGLTWMEFDGTDDILTEASPSSGLMNSHNAGGTSVCVVRPDSAGEGGFGRIFQKEVGNSDYLIMADALSSETRFRHYFDFATTDERVSTASRYADAARYIVDVTWDKSTSESNLVVGVNGTDLNLASGLTEGVGPKSGAAADLSAGSFHIGNRAATDRTFDGGIYEMAVWDKELSDTEMSDVRDFLAAKYSITLS